MRAIPTKIDFCYPLLALEVLVKILIITSIYFTWDFPISPAWGSYVEVGHVVSSTHCYQQNLNSIVIID